MIHFLSGHKNHCDGHLNNTVHHLNINCTEMSFLLCILKVYNPVVESEDSHVNASYNPIIEPLY